MQGRNRNINVKMQVRTRNVINTSNKRCQIIKKCNKVKSKKHDNVRTVLKSN